MAIRDNKEEEKVFSFNKNAVNHFRKEFSGFTDFDQFLLSKKAVFMRDGKPVVLKYLNEDQENYFKKFVNNTPYYFFELVDMSDELKSIPFSFWSTLKEQASKTNA